MKLTSTSRTVIQSDHRMESTSFGIRAEDSPIIMEMMRSKIYSNKPAAVVREYTTNALDEHKLHNIDKDVEVTLPTMTAPELKIRDYGKGLSYDEITEIYVNYGCSTKRASNDLTGGLGIGCKAGFAYGSQFTITSISVEPDANGVDKKMKRVYIAVIDESNTGTLKFVSEDHTPALHTGIEIGIGIKEDDISAFRKEAWNLYLTAKDKPKLIGRDTPELSTVLNKIGYRRYEDTTEFSNNNKYTSAVAVMGNIGYPINAYHLPTDPSKEILKDSSLHIDFEIGDLSIASNREELEYNEDTVKALAKRTKEVFKEVVNESVSKITQSKCTFEQQKEYALQACQMPYGVKRKVEEELPDEVTSFTMKMTTGKGVHYQYRNRGHTDKLFADSDVRYIRWNSNSWNNGGELCIGFANAGLPQANITRRVKSFMLTKDNARKCEVIIIYKQPSTSLADARKDAGLPYIDSSKLFNIEDFEPLKASPSTIKGSKSTSHVSLFKKNRDNRHYQMQSNTWVDAGQVSLSSTSAILYMHLSGVSAIRPTGKDTKSPHTKAEFKVDKDDLDYLENIVTGFADYMTKEEKKMLAQYFIDADGKPTETFSLRHSDYYGVRKAQYSVLKGAKNAINLYELAQELVKRKIKDSQKYSTGLSDSIITKADALIEHGTDNTNSYHKEQWVSRGSKSSYMYGYSHRDNHYDFLDYMHHAVIYKDDKHSAFKLARAKVTKVNSNKLLDKVQQVHNAQQDSKMYNLIKVIEWLDLMDEVELNQKGALKRLEMFSILKKFHIKWPMFEVMFQSFRDTLTNTAGPRDTILWEVYADDTDEDKTKAENDELTDTLRTLAVDDLQKYLAS